ncbi:MAG: hypothetical protein IJ873_05755 [Lachnospiraceae bacterium]|nr:hypothetical protein [Lachnospiraceae bacterium]
MIYLLSVLLFLIFFVLAFIAGFAFRVLTRQRSRDIITICSQGMIVIILLFMICSELAAALHASVRFAGAMWLAVIFFLELLFIFVDRKRFPRFFRGYIAYNREKKGNNSALSLVFAGLIVLLLLLQIYFVVRFACEQGNTSFGLADATLAYDTGRIVISSPMMMLYAWLAILIRVHPLTIVYTVAPVILLPMYYGIGWSLAKKLFGVWRKDDREALRKSPESDTQACLLFMLFFSLLHLFGYQSGFMIRTALLFSYFSGEAFLVHALLPLALWFVLDRMDRKQEIIYTEEEKQKREEAVRALRPSSEELPSSREASGGEPEIREQSEGNPADTGQETDGQSEEWDMKHKVINTRNLAIAVGVLFIVLVGTVFVLNRKINSLYTATVGLQESLGGGVRVYEFIPEGEETAAAYIAKQTNGALIVIGGGPEKFGEELFDFLAGYGGNVDSWYLKGKEKEDTGAYEACLNLGTKVGAVYYLNLEEMR